jgi:hypothetical protein
MFAIRSIWNGAPHGTALQQAYRSDSERQTTGSKLQTIVAGQFDAADKEHGC